MAISSASWIPAPKPSVSLTPAGRKPSADVKKKKKRVPINYNRYANRREIPHCSLCDLRQGTQTLCASVSLQIVVRTKWTVICISESGTQQSKSWLYYHHQGYKIYSSVQDSLSCISQTLKWVIFQLLLVKMEKPIRGPIWYHKKIKYDRSALVLLTFIISGRLDMLI